MVGGSKREEKKRDASSEQTQESGGAQGSRFELRGFSGVCFCLKNPRAMETVDGSVEGHSLLARVQSAAGRLSVTDVLLVRLYDTPVHDHLVEHKMRLLQIEHDVQLAHGLEELVQRLHEAVDELQDAELVLVLAIRHAHDEEQRRVSSKDDFVAAKLEEGALELVPRQATANHLRLQRRSLGDWKPLIVRSQARLSLLVHLSGQHPKTTRN
eukprot:scaffold731_cov261-Pinguiococcus_pyrenoidosus.AAC.73